MLFDFVYISPRWIWLALTVIFTIIEGLTFGLTTMWFAVAALIMIFVSFLPIAFVYQVIIFLVIATALLIFTRPIAVKKFKTGRIKTNVDSLAGKHAIVTKQIGEFDTGEVKINGQIWSARSEDNSVINEGIKCEVARIEGVHAIVRPLPVSS
jgi:membrane protein implicated in regulation of membrane protease activity